MADERRPNEQSQTTPEIERRCFIQAGLASAGTVLAASALPSQVASAALPPQMTSNGADQIPRRPLGKTGEQVSIIGLGGYHLGTVQSREFAVRWFRRQWMLESPFSTTHGSTTTTAVKNGWGLDYRAGATRFS